MTFTLDRVILHTVMHHSSTSIYIPNFIEIEETFSGWTDGRMDGRTDMRPTRPKKAIQRMLTDCPNQSGTPSQLYAEGLNQIECKDQSAES